MFTWKRPWAPALLHITKQKDPAYFLAPAVLPGDPLYTVSGVAEPITAGKLLAVPVGMTTLGTDQSQEVESAQVDLQATGNELLMHTSLS